MPDRVPTKLKLINGDKPNRINLDEPAARELTKIPTPPAWMTVSQVALFRQVSRELLAMRLLYSADLDCLVQYVVAADTCNLLSARINDLSHITVTSESGMIHAHPYFAMLDRAQTRLQMLAKQFGLTPVARLAIRMADTGTVRQGAETPSSYFAG